MIREDEKLLTSKEYRALLDSLPDFILLTDSEYRILFANRAVCEVLEKSLEELCDMRMVELIPAASLLSAGNAFQAMERERSFDGEWAICSAGGREIQIQWRARAENGHGLQIWSGRPVVHTMQSYEDLFEQVKRKDVLLKETHHRIKNNLQVVASLINLQAQIDGVTVAEVRQESQNRIRTMALIHEQLYESVEAEIDLTKYIHQLAQNLCSSYSRKKEQAKVVVERCEEIFIHLDQAVPCGLIANEIISNSLKYAFSPGTCAEIQIAVFREGDLVVMELSDNGKGLPDDVSCDNAKTLGLRLVKMLVGQLSGNLTTHQNGGTHYRIEFKASL